MTSEVEQKPSFVTGGYGWHGSQGVKNNRRKQRIVKCSKIIILNKKKNIKKMEYSATGNFKQYTADYPFYAWQKNLAGNATRHL